MDFLTELENEVESEITDLVGGSVLNEMGGKVDSVISSVENTVSSVLGGSLQNNSSVSNGSDGSIGLTPDQFKLPEEEEYSDEIAEFCIKHTDAQDIFTKRDEEIDKYISVLNEDESYDNVKTEKARIAKARVDVLNGYISRLIIGYFKKRRRRGYDFFTL